jgi:hypothetical protein
MVDGELGPGESVEERSADFRCRAPLENGLHLEIFLEAEETELAPVA